MASFIMIGCQGAAPEEISLYQSPNLVSIDMPVIMDIKCFMANG